jgi:tetratricopeptide (TPR) repeat protein
MGQMYFFAGDLEQALAACHRALDLDPQHGFSLLYLFYIHAKAGHNAEAADAYLRFIDIADPPGSQVRRAGYKDAGLRGLLRQDIDYFVNLSRNPMSHNRVAEDYALMGDHEQQRHLPRATWAAVFVIHIWEEVEHAESPEDVEHLLKTAKSSATADRTSLTQSGSLGNDCRLNYSLELMFPGKQPIRLKAGLRIAPFVQICALKSHLQYHCEHKYDCLPSY